MERRMQVEREIAHLERRLKERGASPGDAELVETVKNILVGMRREHEQMLDTLDGVIHRLERMARERRGERQGHPTSGHSHQHGTLAPPLPSTPPPVSSGSEGGERLGLDSLVERVEVAVKGMREGVQRRGVRDENSLPIWREPEPEPESATLPLDMSMATIRYLTKYDLLSPHRDQHQRPSNHHRARTQRISRPSPPEQPPPFTRILDEQVIKRMPKL